MERLGIVDELQASTAALVESARRRGMSESAIARLPRIAHEKPKPLPPVVLAGRSEANPGARARMLAYRERIGKVRKKARIKPALGTAVIGRPEILPADRALYRLIVDLAAEAGRVPAADILDFIRPRRVVPVRHVCWRLLREFSGLSGPAMARLTGRRCHTSIMQGIGKCLRVNMAVPEWAAVYWEVRTRLSAAGHRIVDDLGGKGESRS